MQPLADPQHSNEQPRPPEAGGSELVAWMWQALTAMFGPAFLSAYAADEEGHVGEIWAKALGRLTWRQAKEGMARLGNERRTYPPNLTEVMAACRPQTGGVRYLGLPSPRAGTGGHSRWHCRASLILSRMQIAHPAQSHRLDAALQAKRTLVAEAERAEGAGSPWPMSEFADHAREVLEGVFLSAST